MEPINLLDLASVTGGNMTDEQLLAGGQTVQNYSACFKAAQDKINAANARAVAVGAKDPREGIRQGMAATGAFQRDVATCGTQFPLQ
jgi:hypothetical protein